MVAGEHGGGDEGEEFFVAGVEGGGGGWDVEGGDGEDRCCEEFGGLADRVEGWVGLLEANPEVVVE